jgi:hypothetical protein
MIGGDQMGKKVAFAPIRLSLQCEDFMVPLVDIYAKKVTELSWFSVGSTATHIAYGKVCGTITRHASSISCATCSYRIPIQANVRTVSGLRAAIGKWLESKK